MREIGNLRKKGNIIQKFIYWLTIPNKYCRSFCVTCEFYDICQADLVVKEKKNVSNNKKNRTMV